GIDGLVGVRHGKPREISGGLAFRHDPDWNVVGKPGPRRAATKPPVAIPRAAVDAPASDASPLFRRVVPAPPMTHRASEVDLLCRKNNTLSIIMNAIGWQQA